MNMQKRTDVRKRAAKRAHLQGQASILQHGEPEIAAEVCDLSPTGCKVKTDSKLAIGSSVVIAMPGLGFAYASVVWQIGGQAGLEFEAPLSSRRVFAAIVEAYQARLDQIGSSKDGKWTFSNDRTPPVFQTVALPSLRSVCQTACAGL
jgi:hypothetical protein